MSLKVTTKSLTQSEKSLTKWLKKRLKKPWHSQSKNLWRISIRNLNLARSIEAAQMPFGNTSDSFSVWIKEQAWNNTSKPDFKFFGLNTEKLGKSNLSTDTENS
jgi:hypothetical protein